jgi:hypothetical protein
VEVSLDVDKMSVLLGLNGISFSYSKLIYIGTYKNNCFLALLIMPRMACS